MEDCELIKRIQSGQKEYLNDVAEKYYEDIFRFCRYQTGNTTEAYDLAQETFLRFIRYVHNYKYSNLKAYLIKIARNLCMDYFNDSHTASRSETGWEGEIKEMKAEKGIHDKGIQLAENRIFIGEFLLHISQEQREIIILRFYYEFKLQEISKILGVNLSTVKTRLRLGLNNLQKEMEGMG